METTHKHGLTHTRRGSSHDAPPRAIITILISPPNVRNPRCLPLACRRRSHCPDLTTRARRRGSIDVARRYSGHVQVPPFSASFTCFSPRAAFATRRARVYRRLANLFARRRETALPPAAFLPGNGGSPSPFRDARENATRETAGGRRSTPSPREGVAKRERAPLN